MSEEVRVKEVLIYNWGINDADYQVAGKDPDTGIEWRCPFYKRWKNMIARCHSPAFQRNQPRYKGCTVDERWRRFTDFKKWMEGQDWEGKQLDKDRLVEGNKHYGPDTCMFLTRKENVNTRHNTVYGIYKEAFVLLKTFCDSTDPTLYTYALKIARDPRGVVDIEKAIEEKRVACMGVCVEWEGSEVPLRDLCIKYNKDYEDILRKYRSWTDSSIYAAMFYDSSCLYSFELVGTGGVKYQFKGKQELVEYLGCYSQRVDDYLPECEGSLVRLKELIDGHTYKDTRTIYYVDGVGKYRSEWIEQYETSDSRVKENMKKYKVPFEEAVKIPTQRVRSLRVNGEKMLVKEFWQMYGLVPKSANTIRSQKKFTFKQVLDLFGFDTRGLVIEPL